MYFYKKLRNSETVITAKVISRLILDILFKLRVFIYSIMGLDSYNSSILMLMFNFNILSPVTYSVYARIIFAIHFIFLNLNFQ